MDVHRASEGDHRREVSRAPIGRGLIGEHPALRIAREVHVLPRRLRDQADGLVHGAHVVVEGAIHAAFFALGRAEVADPHVDAVTKQRAHRADVLGDVVDLAGDHQRRHQENGRGDRSREVAPFVVAQLEDAPLMDDLEGRPFRLGEATHARQLRRIAHAAPHALEHPSEQSLPRPSRHRGGT